VNYDVVVVVADLCICEYFCHKSWVIYLLKRTSISRF